MIQSRQKFETKTITDLKTNRGGGHRLCLIKVVGLPYHLEYSQSIDAPCRIAMKAAVVVKVKVKAVAMIEVSQVPVVQADMGQVPVVQANMP